MDDGLSDVPSLLPARMLNEFVYCPRLFYLEWVQNRFMDNAETVHGRHVHRRVDASGARSDLTDDLGKVRSLDVSSKRLGVICKIDVVEGDSRNVVPVDYKRGAPPGNEHRAYDPERIQVCVQGLLLRDAGYNCDHGVLYFAESRQRVEVPFTKELVEATTAAIAMARRLASDDEAPSPLVDSPKCPRCSLVGLCLPDETNVLAARSKERPRRLVPTAANARPLYVTEQGARVGKSKGRITVKADGAQIASVRLIDVSQLALFGNVQVSSQLTRSLLAEGVPLAWFSYGGWFVGMALQPSVSHVQLRLRQAGLALSNDRSIAGSMVSAKILNGRTLLRRNARPRPDSAVEKLRSLAEQAAATEDGASLLGVEGTAARIFFGQFPALLRRESLPGEAFSFEGRNRRPPRDAVNCLLSYAYALLVKDVTAALYLVGFDPAIGVFHKPRFGRPALALDLAEEFRPLIAESTVIRAINNGEVRPSDFIVRAAGVALSQRGRRAMLGAYERRMEQEITHPLFDYKVSYRRAIELQARLLAAVLLGEVPEYEGLVTR